LKEITVECKTHEIAVNLTAFLNSHSKLKAEDLGGKVKITLPLGRGEKPKKPKKPW